MNVDRKTVRIENLHSLIQYIVSAIVLSVLYWFFHKLMVEEIIFILLESGALGIFVWEIAWKNRLSFKNNKYWIKEEQFIKTGGVLRWHQITIPFSRIQHIAVEETILSRKFNLCRVILYTSGTHTELEYVEKKVAKALKTKILQAIETKEDSHEPCFARSSD